MTNPAVVAEVREEIGDDLFWELWEATLRQTSDALERMRGSMARGETVSLGKSAHRLKGSAAAVGMSAIAAAAQALEEAGISAELGRVPPLLDRLEDAFGRTRLGVAA